MGNFHVGVTTDFRKQDGTFLFAPAADLTPLDGAAGLTWDYLRSEGTVVNGADLEDADAVLHLSHAVTAASLESTDRLALLARSGVGLDMVDVPACTRKGVAVTITPEPVARSMGSATVALILALAHRLVERNDAFRSGDWARGRDGLVGVGLTGRTLGLVGFGRIAREIARLLRPFEMVICAHTPRLTAAEGAIQGVEACEQLDELLARSDFVVVACPLNEETRGLINADRLARMRPTAFLINVARGPIVDEEALVQALETGVIAGAGLDVFEDEPFTPATKLVTTPRVLGAPHSLGFTDELVRGCVGSACESILAVSRGELPRYIVNPSVAEDPAFQRKLRAFRECSPGARD
jgi:D-3-phosphoglycerate dehydrogenase